mmetsp:Transcript_93875/g.270479  ORF Transcript_93875/g.270479 Transcript_93875/m.270479 type:complete len:231 (+) Transcript_93875:997-1689(+)
MGGRALADAAADRRISGVVDIVLLAERRLVAYDEPRRDHRVEKRPEGFCGNGGRDVRLLPGLGALDVWPAVRHHCPETLAAAVVLRCLVHAHGLGAWFAVCAGASAAPRRRCHRRHVIRIVVPSFDRHLGGALRHCPHRFELHDLRRRARGRFVHLHRQASGAGCVPGEYCSRRRRQVHRRCMLPAHPRFVVVDAGGRCGVCSDAGRAVVGRLPSDPSASAEQRQGGTAT